MELSISSPETTMTRVALPQLQPENNAWKQLLALEELERMSLSDIEKVLQAEGEINVNREGKREKPGLLAGG
jgi:predicted DNA-binding protein (UPF0251 family)